MNNSIKIIQINLRTTYYLLLLTLKDASETYFKVLADMVITFVRFGLLVWVYYYVFKYKGGSINGETLQTVCWSMFMYFMFMNINPRYIARYIQASIKNGQIQDFLVRPHNFFMYLFGSYFGRRINIFLANVIVGTSFMVYFFGLTPVMKTPIFWLTFFVVFILCFILSFLIFVSLGLLCFWIEDITPLSWIVDKFVMILGGSYLPVALFPPFLQAISTWSPFGASQFLTRTVYDSWIDLWPKLIGIQLLWILFFCIIMYFLFKSALKNVSLNGG